MLKRNTKKQILAAVLSAAFCVCGYGVSDAYTYSGVTSTVNKVAEDENDLYVNNSNITSNGNIAVRKVKTEKLDNPYSIISPNSNGQLLSVNYYEEADRDAPDAGFEIYANGTTGLKYKWQFTVDEWNKTYPSLPIKVGENGEYYWYESDWKAAHMDSSNSADEKYVPEFTGSTKDVESKTIDLGEAAITISNNGKLTGKGDVQTSKSINVNGTSTLSAVGTITGGTITSDGDIVAASNYSVPSGKSTITASTIKSTDVLTAAKDIKVTTGSLSAATIQATSGNITATNTINTSGKVKGRTLNVVKMKASSASVTGALTFSGNTVLNGGASANSKRVSSVGKGTANMDLINLGQMNTAFAGAGKTYTAGGNIAIASSNNAISVIKNGAVKSGDTGIVTGGTVFNITSALESAVNQQTTRLTNLTTSIKDKDTSFTSVNTSVVSLHDNVASAVTALDKKAQNYLGQGFNNITDAGKRQLNAMITTSIKNYQNNLASSVSATSAQKEGGAGIATMEAKDVPSVSTSNNGASKAISAGLIAQGNTGTVTGGEIYEALDTKMNKASLDTALDQKGSASDFAPIKDMVTQNQEDIKGLKDSKADFSSFNTSLEGKVDKSDFDTVSSQVMVNKEDIISLISSKLNADGSNLDSDVYSTKLANGILEKQNTGLVTGGMVYDALALKADTSYVDAMNDGLTKTLQDTALSLNKDMNKMAAGAAALAGLHPQDYNESCKVDFAAGYGHYKDANAVAVGLFYRPSPITTISLSGTVGNGSPMVNAGLSFKIGYGKQVEKVMVKKADYDALVNQVGQLAQVIEALK